MSRNRFLAAIDRTGGIRTVAYGTGTSIACRGLMERTGAWFPEAHLDAEKMVALAMAGHTLLGFDVVMPLFSVCHEAAAMGCNVNWGGPDAMPESGKPIFRDPDDIRIPPDLLTRPGCAVPLRAISLLKERLGDDAAVCGKVFGSWTQAYHYFGVEPFLMGAIDDPDRTRQIIDRLLPVTVQPPQRRSRRAPIAFFWPTTPPATSAARECTRSFSCRCTADWPKKSGSR
jgi:[methyl-Co(III) methanol-specific corrinoid protein]:coenzyme M methyltransferase